MPNSHNRYCYAKRDNQTSWTEIDLNGEHFDKFDTFWTWTVLTQPNNSTFNWNSGEIQAIGNGNGLGFQADPMPGQTGINRWKFRAKDGWINGWSGDKSCTIILSVNKKYRYTPGTLPGSDTAF